jgi:predicted metalloprotease with PDZ domain
LSLNKAVINDVVWDGPAFKAGISSGATVVAVNGREFSTEALDDAIAAAKASRDPIRLTLKYQGAVREVAVDYHGGPQYPHLVRIDGTTDTLSQLVAPR